MALNRRTFVRGLGAALLGGRMLDARTARAQERVAKRLIVFFSPDGTEHTRWRPTGAGRDFSFPAGSILEPLTPVQDHLTVIDGLEYVTGREHFLGMTLMLTNSGFDPPASTVTNGASLDQYVADRIGNDRRFASLELGVQCSIWGTIPESRMSFRGTGRTVPSNEDPRDVYRRLFAAESNDTVRLLEDRRSVIDLVRAELRELEGRLSSEERLKLETHLDALRDMERSIVPVVCGAVDPPNAPSAHLANDNFAAVGRAQMDLLVAALACDLTRVGSIQWSMAASPTVFTWLGHNESHHEQSHVVDSNAPRVQRFVEGERWYAEQFGYLVQRLAALPEPGAMGSLLDHSIVLWVTEVGDRLTHRCVDVPIVVAGGAGGRLEPGRYLRFDGESHGKLYTSLCWALGLDNRSFGDEAYGIGGLDGFLA